jgi:hypothetical protein
MMTKSEIWRGPVRNREALATAPAIALIRLPRRRNRDQVRSAVMVLRIPGRRPRRRMASAIRWISNSTIPRWYFPSRLGEATGEAGDSGGGKYPASQ